MEHNLISAKGGRMTLKKYGKGHFSDMGKRGGRAKLRMFGKDYFRQMGLRSAAARKKKVQDAKSLGQKIVEAVVSI